MTRPNMTRQDVETSVRQSLDDRIRYAFDVGAKGTLSFWVSIDATTRRNQFFEGIRSRIHHGSRMPPPVRPQSPLPFSGPGRG